MKTSKAVKLAVECMRREIQRVSVSANLQEVHGMDWPSAIGASKRRAELREAIEVLEKEMTDGTHNLQAR
jgi:hypothetical protein